jgi:acyl-CoA dehydrogenase
MDMQAFLDPFVRLLEAECSPDTVRMIEAGGSSDALWQAISASGYLDALVPEDAGGAGLDLSTLAPILMALGAYAVPLPVADTMAARALLAQAGRDAPQGSIVLMAKDSRWPVLSGHLASWALVQRADTLVLARIKEAASTGVFGDLSAHVTLGEGDVVGAAPAGGLSALAAILRAAAIAGAADRLLAQTTAYANERVQFGKPIGKQQAIQQQLAVMAQYAVAVRLAAQTGCAAGLTPSLQAAASAKYMASTAASEVAAIAHAVHGAMGISAEFDLQLLTKRLHAWRLADGAETYWAERLGSLRLAADLSSLDFIRTI